ncbi:MAG: OmpA family protein [Elusimicrobia bacterium]|nr:OmpA family protein [Elusimicrobiota bacterium]
MGRSYRTWIVVGLAWVGTLTVSQAFHLEDILVVDDFNERKFVTKLSGALGTWKKDPNDASTGCEISFDGMYFVANPGYSLKVDYDIASQMTTYVYREDKFTSPEVGFHALSYNGVYMIFKGVDVSRFKYLAFSVKGEQKTGYTRKFKLDLKDKKRTSSYIVDGITSNWQRYFIPLKEFSAAVNLKEVQEIGIVFDVNATFPKGTIYLDEVYFATEKIDIEDYYSILKSMEITASEPEETEPVAEAISEPTPEPQETPAPQIEPVVTREAIQEEKEKIEESARAAQFEVKRESENVIVTTRILFDLDKHNILETEYEKIRKMSVLISSHPNFFVEIHGHTDNYGEKQYNLLLSRLRANAVRDALVEKEKIDSHRLSLYGWGLAKPVESNQSKAGRAQNRRVEFVFKLAPSVPVYPLSKSPSDHD